MNQSEIWNKLIKAAELAKAPDFEADPCLFGERHDANKRASITNFGSESLLDLGSVFLAYYNGLAKNLAKMCNGDTLTKNGLKRIIGSGSCLIRNPGLIKAIQDTYQMEVIEASGEEDLEASGDLEISFNNKGNACVGTALFAIDTMTN